MSTGDSVDLSHYDFRDDFTLQEIAALCAGIDPRLLSDASAALMAKYEEVYRAARDSARVATSSCVRVHFTQSTRDDLPKLLLYPAWALARIPNSQDEPAWDEIPVEDWPGPGIEVDAWRFGREATLAWLAGRLFVPAYDFARPGGTILRESKGAKESSTFERSAWPWGTHSTGLLELLRAAANEFWGSYNPARPHSAPKSESVRAWLMERGASQNIADAMATILRPTDIPAGPRKRMVEPK